MQAGYRWGRDDVGIVPYRKPAGLITAVIPIAPGDSSHAKPVQNDRTIKWYVILREVKRPKYLSAFRRTISAVGLLKININGGSKPPPYKPFKSVCADGGGTMWASSPTGNLQV